MFIYSRIIIRELAESQFLVTWKLFRIPTDGRTGGEWVTKLMFISEWSEKLLTFFNVYSRIIQELAERQ